MVGYQPQAPFVYGGKRKSIFQMEMLGQPVHSGQWVCTWLEWVSYMLFSG